MIQKYLLRDIGLTKTETEVYLILLNLNEVIASKIAEKTKISRPHVYDALNKLIEKGMATYVIKNGKKHFKPTDPIKILDYLKEQGQILKEKEKLVEGALPELKSVFQPLKAKPKVEVYEGSEGVKTILNDIIRTGKEMVSFNTLGGEFLKYIPDYIIQKYLSERKKKRIKSRQFYVKDAKIIKHEMVTYKELPQGLITTALFVYGNNVVIFNLAEEMLTIKIESKEIADLYRNQFEFMWKTIK